MAAERRMYLPLAAVVAFVVVGGWRLVLAMKPNLADPTRLSRAFFYTLFPALLISINFGIASARRLNDYHDEFGLWAAVLQSQPQNPIAHHSLGYIYDQRGDTTAALAHFREEVRLDPSSGKAHNALAVALVKSGAYAEAAAEFAEADRLMPSNELLRINLAAVWSLAGQYDKSIAVSRETLKTFPNSWAVYNNLANALQKSGQFDEAVQRYEQALRLNPAALELYNDIADIQAQRGRPDEAEAALKKGLEQATARGDAAMVERFTKRLSQNQQ
jgi:Flp pilus assembly protein TadD